MAFVTRALRELYQGISQQPIGQRLDTQAQEMINGFPSVSKGLSKRLPSIRENLHTTLSGPETTFVKSIRAPNGELMTWRVDILTGNIEVTGNGGYGGGSAYLQAPKVSDIVIAAQRDTVVLLNKSKLVEKANIAPLIIPEGKSFIRFVSSDYNAYGFTAVYKEDNGTPHTWHFTTSFSGSTPTQLATHVKDQFTAQNVTCTSIGDTVYFYNEANEVNIHSYYDDGNNTGMLVGTGYAYGGFCTDPLKLPSGQLIIGTAPNQVVYTYDVKIAQDSFEEGYYLSYNNTTGTWDETIAGDSSGTHWGFLDDTTPLLFDIRNGTTVLKGSLELRTCNSPFPAFTEQYITSVFFHESRLGITSGKSVDFSEINEYTQFFKSTMSQVLAKDAVSFTVATGDEQTNLLFGVSDGSGAILLGSNHAYLLSTTDVSKATIRMVASIKCSDEAQPISVEAGIIFASNNLSYSSVSLLALTDATNGIYTVTAASAHVPYLMKGALKEFTYSPDTDTIIVRGTDPRILFVNNTFKSGREVLQNAWHKWEFPFDIKSVAIKDSILFISYIHPTGDGGFIPNTFELVQIPLGADMSLPFVSDELIRFTPHLDSLHKIHVGDSALPARPWILQLLYPTTEVDTVQLVDSHGSIAVGETEVMSRIEDLYAQYEADQLLPSEEQQPPENFEVYFGLPYKFYYEFSKQIPSHFTENTKYLEMFNSLTLRRFKIDYFDSSQFIVTTHFDRKGTLANPEGSKYSLEYTASDTANDAGVNLSILGVVPIKSGIFDFPIHSRSDACRISIESEMPYPCNFTSVEWSGNLIRKGQRY